MSDTLLWAEWNQQIRSSPATHNTWIRGICSLHLQRFSYHGPAEHKCEAWRVTALSPFPPHLPETFDYHVQIHQVGDGVRFAIIQSLQRLQKTMRLPEERGGESHAHRFRFESRFAVWICSACWRFCFQLPKTTSPSFLALSHSSSCG